MKPIAFPFSIALAALIGLASANGQQPDPTGKAAGPAEEAVSIVGDVHPWPFGEHSKKEQVVFRTRDELLRAWLTDGGTKESFRPGWLPAGKINPAEVKALHFDTLMVVAVFMGKATDHESIRVERIVRKGKKLVVEYREVPIYKGTAPVTAYPRHLVVVNQFEGEVEFKALPPLKREPLPIP